jgi:hypothetical protein
MRKPLISIDPVASMIWGCARRHGDRGNGLASEDLVAREDAANLADEPLNAEWEES